MFLEGRKLLFGRRAAVLGALRVAASAGNRLDRLYNPRRCRRVSGMPASKAPLVVCGWPAPAVMPRARVVGLRTTHVRFLGRRTGWASWRLATESSGCLLCEGATAQTACPQFRSSFSRPWLIA